MTSYPAGRLGTKLFLFPLSLLFFLAPCLEWNERERERENLGNVTYYQTFATSSSSSWSTTNYMAMFAYCSLSFFSLPPFSLVALYFSLSLFLFIPLLSLSLSLPFHPCSLIYWNKKYNNNEYRCLLSLPHLFTFIHYSPSLSLSPFFWTLSLTRDLWIHRTNIHRHTGDGSSVALASTFERIGFSLSRMKTGQKRNIPPFLS